MKTIALILLFFSSKPNEVRQFTHINDNNFVKTEIIILHSQNAMFVPNSKGITQKWEFVSMGGGSYKIKSDTGEGVISFTKNSAIMRVNDKYTYFTNKRGKVILEQLTQRQE